MGLFYNAPEPTYFAGAEKELLYCKTGTEKCYQTCSYRSEIWTPDTSPDRTQ